MSTAFDKQSDNSLPLFRSVDTSLYSRAAAWACIGGIGTLGFLGLLLPGQQPETLGTVHLWLGLLPIDLVAAGAAATVLLRQGRAREGRRIFGLPRAPVCGRSLFSESLLTVLWVYPAAAFLTLLSTWIIEMSGAESPPPLLLHMAATQSSLSFWLSFICATVLIAPLAEEFLFRLVLTESMREMRLPGAVAWSSLCFALAHQVPANVPGLFLLGLVLGAKRRRSGSLAAPVVTHALFNATAVGLLLLARVLGLPAT